MSQRQEPTLLRFLALNAPDLLERSRAVRSATENWLSYVPQTFPHYTRHTLLHSQEILTQLSRMLFRDDKPESCVVHLSASEAYLLVLAAYLHDSGMVVSDHEKMRILRSDEWADWTSSGGAAARLQTINSFRRGETPADPTLRDFLADVQIRFLLAEFVRRSHHLRSQDLVIQRWSEFSGAPLDEPDVRTALGSICAAHGLSDQDLEDSQRFPERIDLLGDQVNVRMLAILLRIGDLLDMSYDRACPLLLSAASPLPAESYAHWSQYGSIRHRLTAPDRIELRAECTTQQEHSLLQDWCQWLVDELKNAAVRAPHWQRHSDWVPPLATLAGATPTIVIKPAVEARYVPSRWVFELDPKAVFERLIRDVYDSPLAFVQELIQNAVDATRCKIYEDLIHAGIVPPASPTLIDPATRDRYPLHIRLETITVVNELSGADETQQQLVVEDVGTGMNEEVIKNYFLQVGRSYYATPEFKRAYSFVPISRFGVGFLSVFAVSDHVVVETASGAGTLPTPCLRLVLSGPRNYLLTEHAPARGPGTTITVRLREGLSQGALTRLVQVLCPRVEFPIVVDDLGEETVVEAESPSQFATEAPDLSEPGATLRIRWFPTNVPGVEGELYVFTQIDSSGQERWDTLSLAATAHISHPLATAPPLPPRLTCFQGMTSASDLASSSSLVFHVTNPPAYVSTPASWRLDVRREFSPTSSSSPTSPLSLSRRSIPRHVAVPPGIEQRWAEILAGHLAASARASLPSGWRYIQRLVDQFEIAGTYWQTRPDTIPLRSRAGLSLSSLENAESRQSFTVLSPWPDDDWTGEDTPPAPEIEERLLSAVHSTLTSSDPTLLFSDIYYLSDRHRRALFQARSPRNARVASGVLALDWALTHPAPRRAVREPVEATSLGVLGPDVVAVRLHRTTDNVSPVVVLNTDHPFAAWLVRLLNSEEPPGTNRTSQTLSLTVHAVKFGLKVDQLQQYVDAWRASDDLRDTAPPEVRLKGGHLTGVLRAL